MDSIGNVYVSGSDGHYLTIKYNQLIGISPVSGEIPKSYCLYQNYPNPFNPATAIRYEIPEVGIVTLKVFDMLGREIATLVNEKQQPGKYQVTWDASGFSSGVYFYKIEAREFSNAKKMVLVK